jgi:hypothetical protein
LSAVALGLTVAGLVGVWLGRRRDPRTTLALVVLAGAGLALAWLPATDGGAHASAWLVGNLPGAGLLRDSQKWIAPFVLLVSVGVGRLGDLLLDRRAAHSPHQRWWVLGLALLPLFLLPGLAWGLLGTLRPSSYPSEWGRVASVMDQVGADDGRTLVLPFSTYRRYDWNHDRAVLDPAPRFFPGELVTEDALVVRGGVVAGESRTARRVRRALATGDAAELRDVLAREQVRWVLLQKGVPGSADVRLPEGRTVVDGSELRLVDMALPTSLSRGRGARVIAVVSITVFVLGAFALVIVQLRPTGRYAAGDDGGDR